MNSVASFALGEATRNKEMRVFDWHKAARLIKESGTRHAEAGLREDYNYTSDDIYRDGEPVLDTSAYLSSTWATPMLYLDEYESECYVMASQTTWDAATKWPPSALAILRGTGGE